MKLITKNFFVLYFLHLFLSLCFNVISYSPFLRNLHNQKGIWNFMKDSSLYHAESLILLNHLYERNFIEFITTYNEHINTKFIAFFYAVFQLKIPIAFIPFHSLLWVFTVLLVFRTTLILFNKRSAIIAVIPLFYISYLTLYMGLLRESFNVLGYALYIFSIVNIYKNKNNSLNIFLFLLSFVILLFVRPFLIPIISLFSFILLIYLYYKIKINLKYLMIIFISITMCLFVNTRSFVIMGLYDEQLILHKYLLNKINLKFTNIDELRTKSDSKKETKFLTHEWIEEEINKNLSNTKFDEIDFNYRLIKKEISGLDVKKSIKIIIEKSVIYKLNNQYNSEADYFLVNVLNKTLSEIIRFNSREKKLIIKEILDVELQNKNLSSNQTDTINTNNSNTLKNNLNKDIKKPAINISIQTDTIKTNNSNTLKNNLNKDIKKPAINISINKSNCIFGNVSSIALRLGTLRSSFLDVETQPGSRTGDINLTNLCDIIKNLPRVFADAFLSPYPKMWFETGLETGKIGRLLSGFETILTYIFLLGFMFTIFYQKSKLFHLYPIIFLCTFIMILTTFAVPNFGALYRMRMGPLLIFFIISSYSFNLMINKFFYDKK